MPQTSDPVADILTATPLAKPLQADAWDAFQQSANADDLASKLKTMPLPQAVKAQLWDMKSKSVDAAPALAPATPGGSKAGLILAASGHAIPRTAELAAEFATNPNVPRLAARAGRVIGAVAPPVVGAVEGGPVGALAGLAAAAKGSWAGGKTGWFTGKLAQNVAAPVANALETVAPYAQALSTLGGAAGVGDLAQMAEPQRQDIGFLGVGHSMPDLEVLQKAVAHGANPGQAAAQIVKGDTKRFGALMTAYMQSRQVK